VVVERCTCRSGTLDGEAAIDIPAGDEGGLGTREKAHHAGHLVELLSAFA